MTTRARRAGAALQLLPLLLGACEGARGANDAAPDRASDAAPAADAAAASDASAVAGDAAIPFVDGGLPDCGFDAAIAFDPLHGSVLQLASADHAICARIERRDDTQVAVDGAVLWHLIDARIGPPRAVVHVDDESALCWKVTHHNFDDIARVWTGSVRYEIALTTTGGHGGAISYRLRAFDGPAIEPSDPYCLRAGTGALGAVVDLDPVSP